MKIDFERIQKDSKTFRIKNDNESYIQTYPEFLSYFSNLKKIYKHNFVIGVHFVYGWMPTVLKKLVIKNEKQILDILNKVKNSEIITEPELKCIKESINNKFTKKDKGSLVGASKLLHFICPEKYAIWDSRVYRYVYGTVSQNKLNEPKLYLEYLSAIKEIVENKEFKDIKLEVEKACNYEVTPFRAVELIMFEGGRKRI